ncbi:MAG: hypothetical protein K1X55_14705 [Chitinophagales bacterium]|nr:hypothetical protein [Chitinophagales bacterium]
MPTPLSETDSYMIFADGEDIFLFDKDINEDVWRVNIGERATCAWIGLSNEWAVIGGKKLFLWKDDILRTIVEDDFMNIQDFKQVEEMTILILTNSLNEGSIVWSFNVETGKKVKICDTDSFLNL